MTVKPTVSLTDHAHAYARSLVDSGRFASLSAVIQHGVGLVEREEEEHRTRLDAIRADLDRRAAEPPITTEEMDARLARWYAERSELSS
ncbi:MAG: type II toxin-antitoxin system ParD family antitoxin [Proteobacteria bacterium]|nr:type II toxin-antitoxin system ParD family antitoxin [Pseudomonadota bacterium]